MSPMPAMREWVWIVQLWGALATSITAIVYLLDLPGSLELRGWVAAAFVWTPGPAIATVAATLRALGLRNPQTRAHVRRVEAIRAYAAVALQHEMAALPSGTIQVEEHELELRQAWVLRPPGAPDGSPTWVLAGDTHALVIGGDLPSTQIDADDPVVPKRWIVERLPETSSLLSLRTFGASIQLHHDEALTHVDTGHCQLHAIEHLPAAIARATVGLTGPYRG